MKKHLRLLSPSDRCRGYIEIYSTDTKWLDGLPDPKKD